MATRQEEVRIRRVIACFAPGSVARPELAARFAQEIEAEFLGLFIEDLELLRFASLPFAREIGFPSAESRMLDVASVERQLRAQAAGLRQALAAALDATDVSWSLRVARAAPADAVWAALAEGHAPALLIPPRGDPRAERRVLRRAEVSEEALRALLRSVRPVLILPE
jgi:hypothetical protein